MVNWICKNCNNQVEFKKIDVASKQAKGDCAYCKIETVLRPGKIK